jgi:hypothetical protein
MGNAKLLLLYLAVAGGLGVVTVAVVSIFQAGLFGQVGEFAPIHVLLGIFGLIAAVAFVVWVISLGVSRGMKSASEPQVREREFTPPTADHAFPVIVEAMRDGPGKFRVLGVDRSSGLDVTDHITADSAANAKVKAELRGIVVTRIDRV